MQESAEVCRGGGRNASLTKRQANADRAGPARRGDFEAGIGSLGSEADRVGEDEEQRRPLLHGLVGEGALPTSHATDDGVGLVYEGTELVEAVADRPGVAAYVVERQADGTVTETRIEPRLLG